MENSTQQNPGQSTGPRTPAGKAISSRNAVTHGFYSSGIVVPEGFKPDFTEMLARYKRALLSANPTAAELIFFEDVFKDAFTTFRIETYLSSHSSERIQDPLMSLSDDKLLVLLVRSKASFHRNLKVLQAHQTSRFLARCFPYPLEERTVPPLADPKPVVDLAKRTGRDFAKAAIHTLSDSFSREAEAAERAKKTPPVTSTT